MTEPTSTLSPLTTQILNVILPIFATFLTGLAGMALMAVKKYLESKGLMIEAQQHLKARAVAEGAVLQAEEKIESLTAAGLASTSGGKSMAKLDDAVETIKAQLPNVTSTAATALALEAVARIPGLGASGNVQAARS